MFVSVGHIVLPCFGCSNHQEVNIDCVVLKGAQVKLLNFNLNASVRAKVHVQDLALEELCANAQVHMNLHVKCHEMFYVTSLADWLGACCDCP